MVGHRHALKSKRLKGYDQLCFQQSASDSTRPEINISACSLRESLMQSDVGDLNSAARLEHASDFREG